MRLFRISTLAIWISGLTSSSTAISLSETPTRQELVTAANIAKDNMLTFYGGNRPGGIPGYALNPDIYYWWQVGGMLGQLIHHWHITGNDSANDLIKQAIQFQSQDNDFLQPENQSKSEGNDDQSFWAFAAMDAAEYNFPAPDAKTGLSWLGLAQAVFNVQSKRWFTDACGGGLKWQIYPWNKGYTYKNMPANGGLFQLAGRLARYTGNQTYVDWAERIWDWCEDQGLVAAKDGHDPNALHVFDGVPEDKCKSGVNVVQFTYNFGQMIMGASMMANHTNDRKWITRTENLMKGLADQQYLVGSLGANPESKMPNLGAGNILSDSADEFQTPQAGNNDEPSFKAYAIRWMTIAGQLVPSIRGQVQKILHESAIGAAGQCTGKAPGCAGCETPAGSSLAAPGSGQNWCGRRWYQTSWDGFSGMGEQMSAMSVFQNNLVYMNEDQAAAVVPYTANTGGTSESKPDAGHRGEAPGLHWSPITTADSAGAWILTIGSCGMVVMAFWFMITD